VDENYLRYATLERAGTKKRYMIDENPPVEEPEPREGAARGLASWVATTACQKIFLPYLDQLIAQAEAEEETHVDSHARMVEAMATKKALRALRADFEYWRGQGGG